MKKYAKQDFPVWRVRRYLEPGPIVLVSSAWKGETNIMTLGWHTVMEFAPSFFGCIISSANYSFEMMRKSREGNSIPRISEPAPTAVSYLGLGARR